jgi:hypothetical protein
VYFDALRVKIRDEGLVRNKAVYLAIAKAQLAIQLGIRFTMHEQDRAGFAQPTRATRPPSHLDARVSRRHCLPPARRLT